MNYSCSRCGRIFACEEIISFCPFCGQAYMGGAQGIQAVTQRIVIGSDSERTIQEKYWKSAQSAISSALLRLRRSLPRFVDEDKDDNHKLTVPEKYKLPSLNLRDFKSLKKCTSIPMFRAQIEDYLRKLESSFLIHMELLQLAMKDLTRMRKKAVKRRLSFELGEWSIEYLEDEHSIDIDEEADFINGLCTDLAETVGNLSPDRLQPDLHYDPEKVDWVEIMKEDEEWSTPSEITEAHKALMKEIRNALAAVMSAINQNSLFVLSAIQFDVAENVPPAVLTGRLKELKDKDYDPIFGEPPEHLIEAFSDAVVFMTNYLNSLPDFYEIIDITSDMQLCRLKEKLDSVKLDALFSLIESWSSILSQELDRLYQSQSVNMLDVYNAIEEMTKTRL